MTMQYYYNLIEGGFWKEEPTNAMMDANDVYLFVFHQPTLHLPGTFILDYLKRGRRKRETGTFAIEIPDDGRVLVKIDNQYFELFFQEDDNRMIWKINNRKRIFRRTEELTGSDDIYRGVAIRIK